MPSPPASSTRPGRQIVAEAAALNFDLVALAARLHGDGEVSSGRRAILANLRDLGPLTVPDLAAMRPVSRQYVQKLVDLLVSDALVSPAPNPRHKRSFVYAITDLGRARLRDMEAREDPLFDQLEAALGPDGLTAALDLLRRLRMLATSIEGPRLAVGDLVADMKAQ